nr:hypothetical protein [Tanacetum cinerariifolium]
MAKTINEEAQLHAKVDGKKITVTESSVRRDIRLVDKEGIDCLPSSTIFEQIALMGGNTLQSDEDSLKLDELMAICTTLQNKVLYLEKTTTTQRNEIASLKRRVKKLGKKNRSRNHGLKRLYKVGLSTRVESFSNEESLGEDASKQGRIDAIDAEEEITLVSVQYEVVSNDAEKEMFDVDVLGGEEVFVAGQNENVVEEVVDAAQDKGKGIMIEEPVKPIKRKDQIRIDEEDALRLQATFNKEERLAREKDEKLAERLQAQEQEEWSIIEKATLLQQLLKKRKKHFAAKRAEEKRNKPPIQAQQRNIMCTYLKNMEGYKLKYLKLKEFDRIQEMFDRAFRRVNTFKDFRTELVEGKEKRAGEELRRIVRIKSLLDAAGITATQVYVNTALINDIQIANSAAQSNVRWVGCYRVVSGPGYRELEEDEFEEEEDPQEEEDDMEVDIEEDGNDSELNYLYKEVDPLNPPPPASESKPEVTIEVENPIKYNDETVLASVHEKKGKAKDKYYGKLILDLGNEVRSSVEQGTVIMEKLVKKLGNAEDNVECKKLKKELEEARFRNTFLRMQNGQVKRDLYWTRARAHEFYQKMIHRGFVFEERLNKAINVPIEDEKSPSSELDAIGCNDLYHFMKQCNYENVDAATAAERARQANDARGSGPVRGQDTTPAVRECTFVALMIDLLITLTLKKIFVSEVWKL